MKKKTFLFFNYLYSLLSSVKLAIFTLSLLALLITFGTFIESFYDSYHARLWVYQSFIFYFILGLLATNLLAVMFSRLPWKKRHIPFLMAHIGILTLLLGSVLTQMFGVDASLYIGLQEKESYLSSQKRIFSLYSSKDSHYSLIFQNKAPFEDLYFKKKTFHFPVKKTSLKVTDYYPFVEVSERLKKSQSSFSSSAIHLELKNQFINKNFYLYRNFSSKKALLSLGPLDLILSQKKIPIEKKIPSVLFYFLSKNKIRACLYKDKKLLYCKILKENESIKTPWMALQIKVLSLLKKADKKYETKILSKTSKSATSAVSVEFEGKRHLLPLNSILRLFRKNEAYILSYAHLKLDLGFSVFLKDFKMNFYPGTSKASSYKSLVEIEGKEYEISMNEPLKYRSYTFYQSSYELSPLGRPIASIFSVNRDPGRFLKYLGSFLIVLGCILLFLKVSRKK